MKFLLSTESVTLPNPAVKRCGEKYVSTLRDLPTKCPMLAGTLASEWETFRKTALTGEVDVVRGDAYAR
jgi:hypothetical protein